MLRVDVDERPDQVPPAHLTRELEREYRAVVDEILELRGDDGRISAFVRSITSPGALADTAGYSPDLNFAQKLQLLETLDVVERLKLALQFQQERLAELASASASATTSKTARRSSSASTSCAGRWTRSARSSAKTTARSSDEYREKIAAARHAGRGAAAGRARAVAARADGRLERRSRR